VEVDRWQAAPSLPSPWSPTGAWAGRRRSFYKPLPLLLPPLRRPGRRHHLLLWTGALQELGVALVKGNEVVYREALHVCATAGGTGARVGATVPTVDPE
jgi:hypothetical protein